MTTVMPSSTADGENSLQPAQVLDARVDPECKRDLTARDNTSPETKRIKVEEYTVVESSTISTSSSTSLTTKAKAKATETATKTTTTTYPEKKNQSNVIENSVTSSGLKISQTTSPSDNMASMGTETAETSTQAKDKKIKHEPLQSRKDTGRSTATVTSSSSSSSGLSASATSAAPATPGPQIPSSTAQPPKSTLMSHLNTKYLAELEYMLREFRKLERQLLGAKGNGSGIEESAGSRERREKLHSFILHLEDTIRQIEVGCKLETKSKLCSTTSATVSNDQIIKEKASLSMKTNLSGDKDEEENVQKLEEHILANLLPVKVRLIKQLAAQQGATRNPIGMPVARRGLQPSAAADKGKGTFAVAAEERRKQAEATREATQQQSSPSSKRLNLTQGTSCNLSQGTSHNLPQETSQRPPQVQSQVSLQVSHISSQPAPSQFGNPLSGNGSSLTQKLHGTTLGSEKRIHGHGVGTAEPVVSESMPLNMEATEDASKRKILYGGMVPGSKQIQSGVSAAVGVHDMIIESSELKSKVPSVTQILSRQPISSGMSSSAVIAKSGVSHQLSSVAPKGRLKPYEDSSLSIEERRKLRKERRKRKKARDFRRREKERQKQIFLQQQSSQMSQPRVHGKKIGKSGNMKGLGKKKGPRSVEYICALCSEAYSSTCEFNPWWALTSHECPKCRKSQVPRIDITSVANAIEYHPALLAHAEDVSGSGSAMTNSATPVQTMNAVHHVGVSHINSQGYHKRTLPQNSKILGYTASNSDEESDLSELSDAGDLSDTSLEQNGIEDESPLTEGELAELEVFGKEYDGPKLTPDHASRLLVMIGHAQTCPGRHKSVKHRDCCNSVKYLMLHVRDCPGTTASFDVCPFPWCRKVKHLMYHLVACPRPKNCAICSPIALSKNLQSLVGLNDHRRMKQKERRKAVMVAAAKMKPSQSKVPFIQKSTKAAVYRSHTTAKKPIMTITRAYKSPNSKPILVGASRVAQIPRAVTKSNTTTIRTTCSKGTNGVVVKSLVKPAGKSSMVVVNCRPQRPGQTKPVGTILPRVPGTTKSTLLAIPDVSKSKPTVAALPGVEIADPLSKLKHTSTVTATATATATVIQQVCSAPRNIAHGVTVIPTLVSPPTSSTQTISTTTTTDFAPDQASIRTSSEIVKACAAAQAALAVNALEQAAKAAMEESSTTLEISRKSMVSTTPLVIGLDPSTISMKDVNKKPSSAPLNTQAVATASAIAASMATVDESSSSCDIAPPSVVSSIECKTETIVTAKGPPSNPPDALIEKEQSLSNATKLTEKHVAQSKNCTTGFEVGRCVQTVQTELLKLSSKENLQQYTISTELPTAPQREESSSSLSPPRFPEVPIVVKEETSEETKKEVPPV